MRSLASAAAAVRKASRQFPLTLYLGGITLLTSVFAWGLLAIGVASYASLVENLVETGNILGSLFYGSILGLFLVAFFLRSVRGTAVFFAGLLAQCLVLILFWTLSISYLWYNLIGCVAVLVFSLALERTIFAKSSPA